LNRYPPESASKGILGVMGQDDRDLQLAEVREHCLIGPANFRCGLSIVGYLALSFLCGCGSTAGVEGMNVQKAVDRGGTVNFPAGTYLLTQTIVIHKSNTIIRGAGRGTVFVFMPGLPQVHCGNDRAFTTPCDVVDTTRRRITGPIAIGDSSFNSSDSVEDIRPGDWLIIEDKDRKPGEVVNIDWARVATVSGNTVLLRSPFRTAFPNTRPWDESQSGLGFFVVPRLVQGIQFRDFTVRVPDSGANAPGISIFATMNAVIDNVEVNDSNGQPLYSYLSKGLRVTNSRGNGDQVLNEFAATVDLTVRDNIFSSNSAAIGLDFGTGYFDISDNKLESSVNSGFYLLDGVHDGMASRNSIQFVRSPSSAIGVLARGTQRVTITDNYLEGGAGPASIGLSIGPAYDLDLPISSFGNIVNPNAFGSLWNIDYDPSNVP
jgi:hypothetical protein